jgi:hypothetical protein
VTYSILKKKNHMCHDTKYQNIQKMKDVLVHTSWSCNNNKMIYGSFCIGLLFLFALQVQIKKDSSSRLCNNKEIIYYDIKMQHWGAFSNTDRSWLIVIRILVLLLCY